MKRKRGPILLRSKGRGVFRKAVSLVASAALALSMVPAVALADDDTSATEFTAPTTSTSVGHDAGVITIGTHAAAEPTAYYLGLDNTTWRASSASNSSSYSSALTDLRLGVFGSSMNESADNYLWNQFYNLWAAENGEELTEEVPVDDGTNPMSAGTIATIETYPDILLSISGTGDSSYAALIGALDENNDDDTTNDYNPLLVPYVATNFVTFINTTYNVAAAADKVAEESDYALNSRYVTSGSYDSVTAIAEAYEDFYQGSQWYILSQIAAGETTRKSIAYVTGYDTSANTVTLSATDASEFGACGGAGRPGEAIRNVTDNVVEELDSYSSSTTSYTVTIAQLVELAPDYIICSQNATSIASALESALETAGLSSPIISGQPSSIVVLNSNSSESAIYIAYYLGFIYNDILPMSDMLAWYYRNLFHVTESNVANAISITCSNISVPEGTTLTGFSDNYSTSLSVKFATGRTYYERYEDAIVAEYPNLMSNEYYENNELIPLTSENVELTGIGTYTSTNQQSGETSTSEGIFATVVYTGGDEDVTLTEWSDYTYTYEVVSFADGVETDIAVGSTVYSIQYAGTYIMHLEGASSYSAGVDITFTFDGEDVEIAGIEDIEEESDDSSSDAVERLSGEGRYQTMDSIVAEGWTLAETVVLVSGENWPDALAASSIAGLYGAPVILTEGTTLTDEASAAISSLGASKVIIVGGTETIGVAVQSSLESDGLTVTRLSGSDRVATSYDVYEEGAGNWGSTAIVASSGNFADSLSISPYAYANSAPIFLVESSLTADQSEALADFDNVIIVGGTSSVSASVASAIEDLVGADKVQRLSGADRYATSLEVAQFCIANGMTTAYVGIASGDNYPDALAGAALCGLKNSALLLVNDSNYSSVATLLGTSTVSTLYVMGGTASVSASVVSALEAVL